MTRWTLPLCLALAACGATDKASTDDTDTVDTDTDTVDTDVADTDDTVIDTDTVDTDVADTDDTDETDVDDTDVVDTDTDVVVLDPFYTVPPETLTATGGNWQFLGYVRSQFLVRSTADLPSTPFQVTELRLRRAITDATDLGTAWGMDDVELWVSTTSAFEASDLSTTFADNLGADAVQVFDGRLDVATAAATDTAFDDVVFPFSTPFAFDPSQGQILFDLRLPTGGTYLKLDCKNDASVIMRMNNFSGSTETADNYSGCGYSMQLVVQ